MTRKEWKEACRRLYEDHLRQAGELDKRFDEERKYFSQVSWENPEAAKRAGKRLEESMRIRTDVFKNRVDEERAQYNVLSKLTQEVDPWAPPRSSSVN